MLRVTEPGAHPIWQFLEDADQALMQAAGRLRMLRVELAKLNLPEHTTLNCPVCGIRLTSRIAYDDHLWNKHEVDAGGASEQP